MSQNPKKEGKESSSPSQYNNDIEKFQEIAAAIKEKYKLSNYDLIDVLLKQKVEKPLDMIPVAVFDNKSLSCLETVVKYMKENLKLGSGKSASLLNRNISTISSTYLKARKKLPTEFFIKKSKYYIPMSVIADRKFSVLESIVRFMKEKLSLSNKEIAGLLNRDNRTIWTVYSRAVKKE